MTSPIIIINIRIQSKFQLSNYFLRIITKKKKNCCFVNFPFFFMVLGGFLCIIQNKNSEKVPTTSILLPEINFDVVVMSFPSAQNKIHIQKIKKFKFNIFLTLVRF